MEGEWEFVWGHLGSLGCHERGTTRLEFLELPVELLADLHSAFHEGIHALGEVLEGLLSHSLGGRLPSL